MIITLYGPDAYRRKKKLDELLTGYFEKKSNLAFEIIDAEDEGALERAITFLAIPSLFQDSKLIVIKNAISGTDHSFLKKFFKNITTSKETTLLLSDGTKSIPKDLSFLKEKPNLTQEFLALEGAKFIAFLSEEARLKNIIIENGALEHLALAFAGDSWGAIQELNKLSLLKTAKITLKLVKNSGVRVENDFFSYISGWFRRPVAWRVKNLENLLASRNDPAKIFNVLAYQDPSRIKRFADYDVEIKSGRLEYEEALLDLALI